MKEKPQRHIVKAITWRIIASLTTFFLGWIVTGNFDTGLIIGASDAVIKIILYFFHERAWQHSSFGLVKEDPLQQE